MSRKSRAFSSAVTTLAAALLLTASAASAQQRPTLTPADYAQWERLGGFQLSPSGEWVVTAISRTDRSVELRLRQADGSGEERVLAHGSRASFSPDGRWLAYAQGVSAEERENASNPIRDRLGLVDLQTGQDTVLMPMRSFSFRDDGEWLAVLGYAVADSVGGDLLMFRPGTTDQMLQGNVDQFSWQDDGDHMAVTLKTAWGSANGVALLSPDDGTIRTLDSRDADYRNLVWDEESARLGVFRTSKVDGMEDETLDILIWDDATRNEPPQILSGAARSELGDTLRVTDYAGLSFRNDGQTIAFGVRPWDAEPADDDEDESGADEAEGADQQGDETSDGLPEVDPADVQVWHWNDDDIIRAQEWASARTERLTHTTVWHRDSDRVLVLGQDLSEPVRLLDGGSWALRPDFTPYLFERRFGGGATDWYRVDIQTGQATQVATGLEGAPIASPDGERLLQFEEDRWVAIELSSLDRMQIDPAGEIEALRSIVDYDYPGPRPSWGLGAWGADGESAYLYDRNDVWLADLNDGSVERLTNGAAAGLEYRVRNMDPDSPFGAAEIEGNQEIWYNLRDTNTKASGFARGRGSDVEPLILEDARVASLTKASDAEVYALRIERWDDSPDVFTSGRNLEDLVQVTRTNPFQDDFAWGRSELIQYTTDAGHDLQAILAYPADFQEGRQYPLILYQYERLSDGLHSYQTPDERSYYNYQAWSQAGYFVLMPDIVYEPGRPGPSALDAVENALDAAVATGHVDPDAMGLIGHSWGGYQAAYLPTRTNRFAASVAGAAITDFISFMGAVHWNGGLPESGHWETGQARMARPAWEDLEGHLESSPVNFIHQLETPVLVMHGDQDGVVDFRQGLEYYNYARRAGKPVVMLVYPGADHGLSVEEQQVDYHRRILQWFGHYLKGEPAPKWITDGETWQERRDRIGG